MKKFFVIALTLSMTLSAGAAFAAKKAAAKKAAPKWECSMGDKKVMTSTLDECMKMGGLVQNYPAATPEKAPKAKKK